MKNYLVIFCLFFLLTACSKTNDNSPESTNYHNANGTFINFTTTAWYITKDGNFVILNLKITGNTNSNKITIKTFGDGVNSDINVNLQPNHSFNKDISIVFTADGATPGSFDVSTQVTAYKGTDTLIATLKSGKMDY
jgi:hypothetical protein